MLQDAGSVNYRTRPGDRKRYFAKNMDDWESRVMKEATAFLQIRYLMAEAIELKGEDDPEGRRALGRMTVDRVIRIEPPVRPDAPRPPVVERPERPPTIERPEKIERPEVFDRPEVAPKLDTVR